MNDEALKVKKRIMFAKGDDLYFIAYNLLIILRELGCVSEDKQFVDYRKLSFLIDFIADPRLANLISERKQFTSVLGSGEKHDLSLAYSHATSRMHSVMRLICALESKGLLSIARSTRNTGFDLYLHEDKLPSGFLDDDIYNVERQNLDILRKVFPRLRTLKLDTMLQQLFTDNGVDAWHA